MKIPIAHHIATIEKKLLPTFGDAIVCTQYAWWLTQAIMNKSELVLINANTIEWNAQHQKTLDEYLEKLINQKMPLQYLLGSTPFAGLDILVRPPILIPRPETEEWCISLIEILKPLASQPLLILDLCTGSGCIALALADALPKAKVYATDNNQQALILAQENAQHNHIVNVEFIYSDLFNQIPAKFTFDMIVANPPYIPDQEWNSLEPSVTHWEDKQALLAADQGLAFIKKIIQKAPQHLRSNEAMKSLQIPQLVLEIDYTQGAAVTDYMKQHHYNQIVIAKDLEGKDRVARGRIDNVAFTPST